MQAPTLAPKSGPASTLRPETAGVPGYAYAMTGLAIVSIWVSVALASIYSPDFVSGSQQEHLPLTAFLDWLWGIIATAQVLLAAIAGMRAGEAHATPWTVLGIGVMFIWLAVVLVSIYTPRYETGSDPTRIPFGALFSPIVGMVVTWLLCSFVKAIYEVPHRAQ